MPRLRGFLSAIWLLLAVCLLALVGLGGAWAETIHRIDSIGITVGDMERALAFYTGVLPFEIVLEAEVQGEAYERLFGVFGMRARIVRLRLGQEQIELIDYLAPEGRPVPADSRSNDEWFQHIAIIVSDLDAAYAQLRRHNVQHASTGPQTLPDWNPSAGGIKAFYFKDPDGNHLEIIEFPPDKGAARWHEPGDALFLGIDHTAIVVRDTTTSLGFFDDALGLEIYGTSENHGIEQERLNNVFGARLLITSLGAPAGPGVEFLEYLSPATGRPTPVDTQANDLWHWQIRMTTPEPDALEKVLRGAGAAFVSPGVIEMPDDALALGRTFMVRDPAGHAVLITDGAS